MKAYKHLVKYSLAQGYNISVWDGEEWQVSHSNKYQSIIDAIESVEEAFVRINDHTVHTVAKVLVIPFGLEDDETVADYTDNEFMQHWWSHYENS
jgi:L-rhamnose mutarotase